MRVEATPGLTTRWKLLRLYLPLGLSSATLALLQPLVDSGVARIGDSEALAAFAVAASLVEFSAASSVLLQHSYLTLVRGSKSYAAFRRFSAWLALLTSVFVVVAAMPGVNDVVLQSALNTPTELQDRVVASMLWMAPVPALLAWRHYRLGILLDRGYPGAVATTALTTGALAFFFAGLAPSVGQAAEIVGAGGYVAILAIEWVLTGVLCRRALARSPYAAEAQGTASISVTSVARHYWPLAASQVALGITRPLVNAILFGLGDPTVSVAAFRLASSLSLIAQHALASLRPVVILAVRHRRAATPARDVSMLAGLSMAAVLAFIGSAPAGRWLIQDAIGAPPDVAAATQASLFWMALVPIALGSRQFHSGLLFVRGETHAVGMAAGVRLLTLVIALAALGLIIGGPGAPIAGLALSAGYVGEAGFTWGLARRLR